MKKVKEPAALSQDFASFDILWFDLVTKTRALVGDLTQPLVDKVHSSKDLLGQLMKQNEEQTKRISELEATVFNSGANLDVFDQIYKKIATVEGERKEVEQRLEANDEKIMRTFEEYKFSFDNNDKQMKTLVKASEEAVDELRQFKEEVMKQQ